LEHCYEGVGKHCCIQEHYYEQSEARNDIIRGVEWSCNKNNVVRRMLPM
jgi:hypothetical protein